MLYRRHHYLWSVLLGGLLSTLPAWSESDSPESLDEARRRAAIRLEQGERLDTAQALLETLRAIPPERTDLAVAAVGTTQLLLFDTEYLMTEEERAIFYTERLDETKDSMDRFLATIMRLSDDAGISQEEMNRYTNDLASLTRNESRTIRLGSLFIMSNPYYYYDTLWAKYARRKILRSYPDSPLAQEAQRLALYRSDRFGPKGLEKVFNLLDEEGEVRSQSLHLRTDPLGAALYQNILAREGTLDERALIATATNVAAQTEDWTIEYAALNFIAHLDSAKNQDLMVDAADAAIARNREPRCVFRARTLRMDLSALTDDRDVLRQDAEILLALRELPLVPERNNYEELKNSIHQAAEALVRMGHPDDAIRLLHGLTDRFPGSALAQKTQQTIETLTASAATGSNN